MSYDLFLFDFDGVLFTTNRAKSKAFREALTGYPEEAVDKFIGYHEANGGISRYVKFSHFFKNILCETDTEGMERRALERFVDISKSLMEDTTTLPGVRAFVHQIRSAKKPAAICSGGNFEEIQRLLSVHRLSEFFAAIWANERTKMEHATENIGPYYKRVLFFGDAQYDMEVAELSGWDFVFVSAITDWPDGAQAAQDRGHFCIHDFQDCRLEKIWVR